MISSFHVRLFKSGAPAAVSTAFALLIPIMGRFYLGDDEYAAWALIATVATMGLLIDLGGPSLAVRLAGAGPLTPKHLLVIGSLTGSCSVLVGVIAALIWPYYSSHITLAAPANMQLLLLATGMGAALRSFLTVLAAIALGRERFFSRGSNLILQVVLQCGIVWVSLATGLGVASMPLSILTSCIPLLPIYLYDFVCGERAISGRAHKRPLVSTIEFGGEVKKFMTARGAAAVLSLAFTQIDRWLIALSGDATFVANYDLAARIAVIPKTALLTLGLGFVHEAARLTSRAEVRQILRKSYQLSFAIISAGAAVALIGGLALHELVDGRSGGLFVGLLLVLLVSNSAHAMTAPGVLVFTGLGKPQYELAYLIPAGVTSALCGTIAVICSSPWGTTFAIAGSLFVWSSIFSISAPKAVIRSNYQLAAVSPV